MPIQRRAITCKLNLNIFFFRPPGMWVPGLLHAVPQGRTQILLPCCMQYMRGAYADTKNAFLMPHSFLHIDWQEGFKMILGSTPFGPAYSDLRTPRPVLHIFASFFGLRPCEFLDFFMLLHKEGCWYDKCLHDDTHVLAQLDSKRSGPRRKPIVSRSP